MARTAKQKAALRKAQLASARKRRGKGKGKLAAAHRKSRRNGKIAVTAGLVAAGVAVGAGAGYVAYKHDKKIHAKRMARVKYHGKKKSTGHLTHDQIYGAYAKQKRF